MVQASRPLLLKLLSEGPLSAHLAGAVEHETDHRAHERGHDHGDASNLHPEVLAKIFVRQSERRLLRRQPGVRAVELQGVVRAGGACHRLAAQGLVEALALLLHHVSVVKVLLATVLIEAHHVPKVQGPVEEGHARLDLQRLAAAVTGHGRGIHSAKLLGDVELHLRAQHAHHRLVRNRALRKEQALAVQAGELRAVLPVASSFHLQPERNGVTHAHVRKDLVASFHLALLWGTWHALQPEGGLQVTVHRRRALGVVQLPGLRLAGAGLPWPPAAADAALPSGLVALHLGPETRAAQAIGGGHLHRLAGPHSAVLRVRAGSATGLMGNPQRLGAALVHDAQPVVRLQQGIHGLHVAGERRAHHASENQSKQHDVRRQVARTRVAQGLGLSLSVEQSTHNLNTYYTLQRFHPLARISDHLPSTQSTIFSGKAREPKQAHFIDFLPRDATDMRISKGAQHQQISGLLPKSQEAALTPQDHCRSLIPGRENLWIFRETKGKLHCLGVSPSTLTHKPYDLPSRLAKFV